MNLKSILARYTPGPSQRAVFTILGIISLSVLVYMAYVSQYVISSDAISYISIAEQYASGEFRTAVNGYWSPMISWLLTPFIVMGVDPRLAFALINGIASFVAVAIATVVVWVATRKNFLATIVVVIAGTLFLRETVPFFFPDILAVVWSMLFLATLMMIDRATRKSTAKKDVIWGMILGVVGVIGYLIKLYLLPYFVGVVVLWVFGNLLMKRRAKRGPKVALVPKAQIKTKLRLPGVAAIVFVVVAAPWIGLLSLKYGYITIGSSFSVNAASSFQPPVVKSKTKTTKAEPRPDQAEDTREKVANIAEPPHQFAVSSTEDRTPRDLKGNAPSLGGGSGLRNFVERRLQGIPLYLQNLQKMWGLLLVMIIAGGIWLLGRKRTVVYSKDYYTVFVSLAVYFGGYALIAGHNGGNIRYYWPMFFFGLIIAAYVIADMFVQRWKYKTLAAGLLAAIVVISVFTTYPVAANSFFKQPRQGNIELAAKSFLQKTHPQPYDDYLSNNGRLNRPFAYFVQGQAYGSLGVGHSLDDIGIYEAMKREGIDYFLQFAQDPPTTQELGYVHGKIIATYDLGKSVDCLDRRSGKNNQCALYVIQQGYATDDKIKTE